MLRHLRPTLGGNYRLTYRSGAADEETRIYMTNSKVTPSRGNKNETYPIG